jgi:hypothetical protein
MEKGDKILVPPSFTSSPALRANLSHFFLSSKKEEPPPQQQIPRQESPLNARNVPQINGNGGDKKSLDSTNVSNRLFIHSSKPHDVNENSPLKLRKGYSTTPDSVLKKFEKVQKHILFVGITLIDFTSGTGSTCHC